jgi:hypothetical protein
VSASEGVSKVSLETGGFSKVQKNMVSLQYPGKRDISYIDSRILSLTTCLEILTKQDVDVSFVFVSFDCSELGGSVMHKFNQFKIT